MRFYSAVWLMLVSGVSIAAKEKTLKEVYANDFQIGAAVAEQYVLHPDDPNSKKALALVEQEFNCVTSENLMKPSSLRPAPGKFDFEKSDEFVRLSKRLDVDIVGHVLVWHEQTPSWFFEDKDGNPISREELIERMHDHIRTVVKRYKGDIKYWDVVNEAVEVVKEDGESVARFRDTPWYRIIGEDFIELAFKFANEADPKASLIYNDYGMTDPVKVDFVVKKIIRPLKKKGIRIDAVGMQSHWHIERPSIREIKNAIKDLAAAKVKVHITELDLGVLPAAYGYEGADISTRFELQDELNPYRDSIPERVLEQQAERYREIFDLFSSLKRDVERVTLWGISDGDSWKNNFPMRGRTDYPLLFDRNYQPKPAFRALVK